VHLKESTFDEILNKESSEKDIADKLERFFVNGTYNVNYISVPTIVEPTGFTESGTSVVNSIYDVYTQKLCQKSIIQTIGTDNFLQSFDINSKFISMDTLASSSHGKYVIKDNICTVIDNGFGSPQGTFIKSIYTITKTNIGYVLVNSVLNKNKCPTLNYIAYYVRQ
jgi:hypothetical protein